MIALGWVGLVEGGGWRVKLRVVVVVLFACVFLVLGLFPPRFRVSVFDVVGVRGGGSVSVVDGVWGVVASEFRVPVGLLPWLRRLDAGEVWVERVDAVVSFVPAVVQAGDFGDAVLVFHVSAVPVDSGLVNSGNEVFRVSLPLRSDGSVVKGVFEWGEGSWVLGDLLRGDAVNAVVGVGVGDGVNAVVGVGVGDGVLVVGGLWVVVGVSWGLVWGLLVGGGFGGWFFG